MTAEFRRCRYCGKQFLPYVFHPNQHVCSLTLNLKPELRQGKTDGYWGSVIAAEIYGDTPEFWRSRSL